jgi:hypothetical protein
MLMSSDLLSAALVALADAERALLGGGAQRRVFHRQGATLWDPADDRIATARLADRAVRANGRAKEDEMVLAVHSSIARVGKLASLDRLKVRSYLVVDGEVRSLKVWSGAAAVKTGARERDVRAGRAGRVDHQQAGTHAGCRCRDREQRAGLRRRGHHPPTAENLDALRELRGIGAVDAPGRQPFVAVEDADGGPHPDERLRGESLELHPIRRTQPVD